MNVKYGFRRTLTPMEFTTTSGWTRTGGPEKGVIPYADLPNRKFSPKYLEVSLGNGEYFVTAASGVEVDDLLEILRKIKFYVEENIDKHNTSIQPTTKAPAD